jgi:hypothetical protein
MAKALHNAYLRKSGGQGPSPEERSPSVSWEDLPEESRESNRRQAYHIAIKVRQIGCRLKKGKPKDREFIREILAIL